MAHHFILFGRNRKYIINHKHLGLGMRHHHHHQVSRGGDLVSKMANLSIKPSSVKKAIKPLKFRF